MRTVPIPDEALAHAIDLHGEGNAGRVVIGEPGDPTRTDVRPAEYLVIPSTLYPGRPRFIALLVLEDHEREALAAGDGLALALDGGEVPWAVWTVGPATDAQDVAEADRG